MKNAASLIHPEISPKRLYTSVKEISQFHRIQVTPGFRASAEYVCRTLKAQGIDARILTYKAHPDIWYLQNKMFLEWDLENAWLDLQEPFLHLANAKEEPMSIVQRSYPADFTDGAELFVLDRGTDQQAYADVNFEGKIVFMHELFHEFDWVFEKGAIGFVTDHIAENASRTRNDLYHSLTYTSFWWKHTEEEKKIFGFVLSPAMGDRLVQIYRKRKAENLPTILKGKVDTDLHEGTMEVVEAVLPGTCEEEVLLTSHLCHPKASCNDNASGCAANMEVLRALKSLMNRGALPRNRRTIKAIFMPEYTGTFAYLSDHTDYNRMIGALNLDMVGGRQTRAYGPITLTLLPDTCPSIIQSLTHLALQLAGQETENLLGEKIPLTHSVTGRFTGGSDHTVYTNPDFNVPCCMLGQWPDRNYHTATDTLEVIDPEVLAFSTRTAAIFAYGLACLKKEDLPGILEVMHVEMAEAFAGIRNAFFEGKITEEAMNRALVHKAAFFENCVKDLERILPGTSDLQHKEIDFIKGFAQLYVTAEAETINETDERVLQRTFLGPIQRLSDNAILSTKEVQKTVAEYGNRYGHNFEMIGDRLSCWMDGTRSVSKIKQELEAELLADEGTVIDGYLDLLLKMHLAVEK